MNNVTNININQNDTSTKVSETYRKIEHEEVYNIFRNALDKRGVAYSFDTQRLGRKNTTVGFRFILTGMEKTLNGDKVTPAIVGRNSLNGESSLHFRGGAYRFCCANSIVIGKDMFIGKIIHRKGETFEQKVKDLDYQIAAFLNEIDTIFGKVEEATSTELSVFQMAKIVEQLKVPKKVKKEARRRLINDCLRREEDKANNTWTLWNVVNEVIRNTCTASAGEKHNDNLMSDCIKYAKAA